MKRRAAPIGIRIMRVLAWVVVGAVINVGVTWLLAWQVWPGFFGIKESRPIEIESWPVPVPSDWPAPNAYLSRQTTQTWSRERTVACVKQESLHRAYVWSVTIAEMGAPFLSLAQWIQSEGDDVNSEMVNMRFRGMARTGFHSFPLYPVWPGFALNTLFYAALAWGLWQLPLALRRWRRNKRGLCVRCGYDLKGIAVGGAGTVCPECGAGAAGSR